jgi:outer membrane protein OmpA-like peptidoglycan-associated protein
VERPNFFWASYSDLMTSLFFVMLVLYVLTFKVLKQREEEYKVKAQQFERMQKLEASVKQLDDKKNFEYDVNYKRFTLKKRVRFATAQSTIPPEDAAALLAAGMKLGRVINEAKKTPGLRYLVIVEGMASRDNYTLNSELSYARAKAVLDFWRSNGIVFNPAICETLIAGSGTSGIGRSSTESQNQRILVQVIPKIGK